MKHLLIALFIIPTTCVGLAQDPANPQPPKRLFSVGGKSWGIGLGNGCARYTGIRIKLYDNGVESAKGEECTLNGINLNVFTDANSLGTTNGANLGIIFFDEYKVNGLALSPIGYALGKMNGFAFSGISMNVDKQNGIAFSGLFQFSKRINGVSFAGLDIASKNINGVVFAGLACLTDSVMNGVELSPIFSRARIANGIIIGLITKTDKTRGIQLGLINRAITMRGVQIGLVNYIKQNPVWCRTLPFINLRFKKDKSEMADK